MKQAENEVLLTRPVLRFGERRLRPSLLMNIKLRESVTGYLFLAPSIILFAIFLFYPLAKSVCLSLYLTDPRGRVSAFVGLDNYIELFASGRFFESLAISGLFALLTVPTGIVLALLLAALTQGRGRGMQVMQFIFSVPVVLSVGTASVMWMMLYHPSTGMLNYFLGLLGLKPVFWLSDPKMALLSVSLMTVWMNVGFLYIVLLSGMKGIPEELYDSAKIDGAGPVRTFFRITLPLLSPTLFFVTIVSVIQSLQSFGQIHILTKGGPVHQTDVVVYAIYQEAFINFRFGSGSAQALVLFAIILALTLVQFRVLEKKVHYQ